MPQRPRTTESQHIRIQKDVIDRVRRYQRLGNIKSMNWAYEDLLYDALDKWEATEEAQKLIASEEQPA